jgi:streptogramin lyase
MLRKTASILLLAALAVPVCAQRRLQYDNFVASQVRIDLRDLGYPPVDVIPSGESAIQALAVAPDGALYGTTTGTRSHLFVLQPVHGYVQPLGYLKDTTAVHSALAVAASGDVYIGTAGTGRLLKYTPRDDDRKPIRVDRPCETTDLGAPVAGDGIYTMALDRERSVIYGLSEPNGQFFRYDIGAARFTLHGTVAANRIPGENFEQAKNISRSLALDAQGRVYASGEDAALFRFDPATGKLERLAIVLPTIPERAPYDRVDAFARDSRGVIYGGTSDGYLFRLDPRTLEIANLGKPLNQYRIRGLAFAPDGVLYGVGGDDDEMARLFSFDPAAGVYRMLGMIDVNRRPYYSWQAYRIGAVAMGLDGTLYLGQSERVSRLYLYYPVVQPRKKAAQ